MRHRMLPLYEAKMIHQYDHRWATYERNGSTRDVALAEKADSSFIALPRYWVRAEVVADRLAGIWDHDWLLGWRDICRSTDERTCIAAINGKNASPEGGTLLTFCERYEDAVLILSNWNTFVFDFVARQKVGGTHLKYFTMRQLPMVSKQTAASVPAWSNQPFLKWVRGRVLALVVDNDEMSSLAGDFTFEPRSDAWVLERRAGIRAEIDAAYFQLYGVARDDVDYIMDTFPITRRKDIAAHGEYRIKRMILEIFDAMAEAEAAGVPYASPFDELNPS